MIDVKICFGKELNWRNFNVSFMPDEDFIGYGQREDLQKDAYIVHTYYDLPEVYNKSATFVENAVDDLMLADKIRGIKDEKIRDIMILCGYFVVDEVSLIDEVIELYETSSDKMKERLNKIYCRDNYLCSKFKLNEERTKIKNNKSISINSIIRIFNKWNSDYISKVLVPYLIKSNIITEGVSDAT